MKLSIPYKKLFNLDINEIKILIDNLSDEEWNCWDFRQKNFENHSQTKTYPLMFWTNLETFQSENGDTCNVLLMNESSPIWKPIKNIIKILENYYNGKCINAIITKLPPKSNIPFHTDGGYLLEMTHRLHIPIKTNKNVFFFIKDKNYNFEEGVAYEISNIDIHAVENNSSEDRVHLILDFVRNDLNLPVIFYSETYEN